MGVVYDAGIDWLTMTCKAGEAGDARPQALLKELITADWYVGQSGVDTTAWRWNGYEGWAYGPLRWGFREDGQIIRLSGPSARLATSIRWTPAWRPTRIDLQATVVYPAASSETIDGILGAVLLERASREGRRYRVNHIRGMGDGDTITIGSRSSEKYVRVYDKYAESAGEYPRGSVRYELEAKGELAKKLWPEIALATDPMQSVGELVGSLLAYYGIPVPELSEGTPSRVWASLPRTTDLESRLAWLDRSVRPMVERLILAGHKSDVERALGLGGEEDDDEVQGQLF